MFYIFHQINLRLKSLSRVEMNAYDFTGGGGGGGFFRSQKVLKKKKKPPKEVIEKRDKLNKDTFIFLILTSDLK